MKRLIVIFLLITCFNIQTYAQDMPKTGGTLPPAPLTEDALKNLTPAQQNVELIQQLFNNIAYIKTHFAELLKTAQKAMGAQFNNTDFESSLMSIKADINNLGSSITLFKDALLKLKPADITTIIENIKKINPEKGKPTLPAIPMPEPLPGAIWEPPSL